jgi:hypothetical protein
MRLRLGGDLLACSEFCSRACADVEQHFGYNAQLCGWIIENRPDPTYTPEHLQR